MPDAVTRYRRTMRESEIEKAIIDAVHGKGGYAWHVRDSRKMAVESMPDLLIVLPPCVALFEAKSQYRQVTFGQQHVLDLLAGCTEVLSGIVRPIPREGEMSLDEALMKLGMNLT